MRAFWFPGFRNHARPSICLSDFRFVAQGNLNGTEARIGWVSRMRYDEHSTTSEKYVDAFYFSF